VHPARLARGLAREVERLGGTIHERTAVRSLDGRAVRTEHGTVRADVVVRGTEAYTRTLGSAPSGVAGRPSRCRRWCTWPARTPRPAAAATSLLVVGTAALVGMVGHARAGRVRFAAGIMVGLALPFTIAALGGVVAGSRVADRIDARTLVGWFAASLVVLSLAMITTHVQAVI
jgi:glycine/D-amino acid oxidase-like deaminating enzyme